MIHVGSCLYAKLETVNPTGSIKDRPMKYIVELGIKNKEINGNTTLVEATSGNTGIALSAIGAALGLAVKIIMPRNMSQERRQMMLEFGSEIIDVEDSDFEGAIRLRNEMIKKDNHWSPMQFENHLNIACHRETTGREIIEQIPKSTELSAFVSGAGTGGTIMGVREAIVDHGLSSHVCLVVPDEESHMHGIQGIGDGHDFLVNPDIVDMKYSVKTDDAIQRASRFAKEMGVLVGISAGANLCAAEKYIKTVKPSGAVVTILCDRGERYLSV